MGARGVPGMPGSPARWLTNRRSCWRHKRYLYMSAGAHHCDPQANVSAALAILQRLDAQGKLPANQKAWIRVVEASLVKLGK
jgi:hypothetical protein